MTETMGTLALALFAASALASDPSVVVILNSEDAPMSLIDQAMRREVRH